jgi:hypothetical protein
MPDPIRQLIRIAVFLGTVAISAAQSAVPVIQQISDQEMNYGPAGNIPYPQVITFTVSNNPTSITATGLPPGVTFNPKENPWSGQQVPSFLWSGGAYMGDKVGAIWRAGSSPSPSSQATTRVPAHP